MKGFEQHNPYHKYDVLEHCIRAMEAINTDKDNHLYMKISALFHDIGKPLTYSEDENGIGHFYRHPSVSSRLSKEILSRFNADSFTTERVALITKYHDLLFETDRRLLKKWMNKFTPQVLLEILEIKRADNFATGNMSDDLKRKFDDTEKLIYEILDEHQCFSMKDLAINGHDLIALGMKEGPGIGIALAALLEDVICERLQNERAVLLAEAAKRFINKNSCG